MSDKLIFSQTFEGIFRALGPRLTPALVTSLRACGIDPDKPLRPAYPLEVFHGAVRAIGAALWPELSFEQQARALGRDFMNGYSMTMVGRAMVAMMRVVGPQRTLERLSRQFRTGNNFSETKVTEIARNCCELWCNQVTVPGWYQGLLERGLELAGAVSVKAELLGLNESGGTFRVTWENPP